MSAANKKFQSLNRQVLGWKAKDHAKFKDLEISDSFPHCRGTFDTCPSEEEINKLLAEKKAPTICGKCPVFIESKPNDITPVAEKHVPQNMELYNKLFKRKDEVQK